MNNFFSGIDRAIPPFTKHLIFINLLMWLASIVMPRFGVDLIDTLGLHYVGASKFYAFQLLTNMFLHSTESFTHIFFNMFSLWMFGRAVEHFWGGKRFLLFYIACGLSASLLQEVVWYFQCRELPEMLAFSDTFGLSLEPKAEYLNRILAVGASGAVFGLLLAFGMLFPNAAIYLFFIPIPIKAKYFVIGYGLLELYFGVRSTIPGSSDSIAHFAHLGGMIGGLILILFWRRKGKINGPYF
ncbi:rhomboid family intramembrane serine protease [Porphyromonas crevioricanis]|uniref:rhomboid family intramembrane serine protease n=1 Tax=Porphyromonas crevioricanis TaxID=393921 RepID=UPI0005A9B2AE|nr:rhomboid family intramembrane serine protease [Porphyromonas crevioricanis]SJZ54098.1 Membrane associated serine protease, rhomboid family [Porphyromonas crevioricanis]